MVRSACFVACLTLIACTTTESEEDADAAAGDGKADALGFRFGPFTALDPSDGTDKMPLVVMFHKPDGSEDGDHGQFDLTRLRDTDAELYQTGTFKLYTWGGRKRIRFSTYDGDVILRADWRYDHGTFVLDGTEMTGSRKLANELVSCLAVQVLDSNVFEEGLTVYEYPNVSVDMDGANLLVNLGSSFIDHTEAMISLASTAQQFEARVETSHSTYTVRVPTKTPRRGEVLVKPSGEREATVAKIVCQP